MTAYLPALQAHSAQMAGRPCCPLPAGHPVLLLIAKRWAARERAFPPGRGSYGLYQMLPSSRRGL